MKSHYLIRTSAVLLLVATAGEAAAGENAGSNTSALLAQARKREAIEMRRQAKLRAA